ncbi:MAG TPA: hypothetical protein PL158_09420 [Bacillota bacterium]|nr:hypothetical protein [Bacillota bacterium]HOL10757.1 hypothetical protein [Bacillota bacterium]
MVEEIGEPVSVLASFSQGRVAPLRFKWRNRCYQDLTLASTWCDYEGASKRIYFSVLNTDHANLYELCFHTRDLQWILVRIHHD